MQHAPAMGLLSSPQPGPCLRPHTTILGNCAWITDLSRDCFFQHIPSHLLHPLHPFVSLPGTKEEAVALECECSCNHHPSLDFPSWVDQQAVPESRVSWAGGCCLKEEGEEDTCKHLLCLSLGQLAVLRSSQAMPEV